MPKAVDPVFCGPTINKFGSGISEQLNESGSIFSCRGSVHGFCKHRPQLYKNAFLTVTLLNVVVFKNFQNCLIIYFSDRALLRV